MYTTRYGSPVGELLLASDGERLAGVWLAGQKYYAAGLSGSEENAALPLFGAVRHWLDRYFAGARPSPGELPLAPAGTAFQRAVWDLLLGIPYGGVTTYGALAAEYERVRGRGTSPRAVGSAVGRNPISIIIPCHRVVGSDGSLTGYAGGVDRKRFLLELERGTEGFASGAPMREPPPGLRPSP